MLLVAAGAVLGSGGVLLWQQIRVRADGPGPEPSRSYEATVYLPLSDNNGKPFPRDEWLASVGIVAREFGGATLGDLRTGLWRGARGLQREPIRLVTVSFEPSRLERFREVVRAIGRRLGQEAVYVRFEEPRVELIAVRDGRRKEKR
jgi:hypothetical protein